MDVNPAATAGQNNSNVTELTADIVSAYLAKNTVRPEDIGTLISSVYGALTNVGSGGTQQAAEKPVAPMSWKKAIKPDGIVSFEDGKSYKSMKRHLTTRGITPEQYREKWGLPRDFPMVAPNYAAARSELARKSGLGTKGSAARKAKGGSKMGGSKKGA